MALLPILMGAGALYSAAKGSQNQGKANDLNEQALELARADYEDRRPLREAFTQGAMTPIAQAPDLSSLFAAARSDNSFASGGPPRSAHVPSQLPPMGRMGTGTTVDGPRPDQMPRPDGQSQSGFMPTLPPEQRAMIPHQLIPDATPSDRVIGNQPARARRAIQAMLAKKAADQAATPSTAAPLSIPRSRFGPRRSLREGV